MMPWERDRTACWEGQMIPWERDLSLSLFPIPIIKMMISLILGKETFDCIRLLHAHHLLAYLPPLLGHLHVASGHMGDILALPTSYHLIASLHCHSIAININWSTVSIKNINI